MANRYLLCLLLLCVALNTVNGKFGRGGGSRSRGSSSGRSSGWGWGSSSGRSSSSSSWGWGSSSSARKPSSSSSSHSYPSSSSGLSGSGSSSHSYPSSYGLSGSGSSSHSYPSSSGSGRGTYKSPSYNSIGMPSPGSQSSNYPASTGLSGSGSSLHSYPSSSGSGRGTYKSPSYDSIGLPVLGDQSSNYPVSHGLSGSQIYKPALTGVASDDFYKNLKLSIDKLREPWFKNNAGSPSSSDKLYDTGLDSNLKKIMETYNTGSNSKNPSKLSSPVLGSGNNTKSLFDYKTTSHSKYSPPVFDSALNNISKMIQEMNNSFNEQFSSYKGLSSSQSRGTSGSSYPWSTGLSGYGSGSKYPASTGLSGSGSSSKYPASTGLSGSGSSSYHPASTGLSGTNVKYPPSTGLSGSNVGRNQFSHNIPSSSTGLSGSGTSNYNTHYSNTNYHKPDYTYHPSNSYNSNSGYKPNTYRGPTYSSGPYGSSFHVPTYYSSPQHVYITQYRDSGSRYNDLLTGLALYNLGRSHTHYHDHYYYDDYYRRRYDTGLSSSSDYRPTVQNKDEAHCILRIKEKGKVDELKIPCEIVSTFTEGSKKVEQDSVRVENTVCQNYTTVNTIPTTTNSPLTNKTTLLAPSNESSPVLSVIPISIGVQNNKNNLTEIGQITPSTTSLLNNTISSTIPQNETTVTQTENGTIHSEITRNNTNIHMSDNITISTTPSLINFNQTQTLIDVGQNVTTPSSNVSQNITFSTESTITSKDSAITTKTNDTISTTSKPTSTSITETKIINSTCTTVQTTQLKDPLTIKGPPPNPNNIDCEVEIVTKEHRLKSKVNCLTLMEYSKMPEPKKDLGNIPPREQLKSWLSKPPWWLAMFIAV